MYEKTISDISKSLRVMSKRVRRAEAQLSSRRGVLFGTTTEREDKEQAQLWWDTDLNAFMANMGDGWEPIKDVRTGTATERIAYPAMNTGEFWWDTTEERLYAWGGHEWESTDIAEAGTTVERNASSPVHGQWWFDTDDNIVYVYDGIEWSSQASSRYIEPFLLLSQLFGLFTFIPFLYEIYQDMPSGDVTRTYALVNIMDYAKRTSANSTNPNPETKSLYRMSHHNSPVQGDNGLIPYLNFVSSSSQYCTTRNYRTTGDLTILAWVSPDTTSSTRPIVDKWYETNNARCYRLVLWSDKTFRFYISDGTTTTNYVATDTIVSNELKGWNFVVARYKVNDALEIYHNGTWSSFSGTVPDHIHDYDDDIVFGKSNAASPVYFDGQMSVVAICKGAISDELIDYIYETTKISYMPQPEPRKSENISVGENINTS